MPGVSDRLTAFFLCESQTGTSLLTNGNVRELHDESAQFHFVLGADIQP